MGEVKALGGGERESVCRGGERESCCTPASGGGVEGKRRKVPADGGGMGLDLEQEYRKETDG